jgi:hypothetical protein
MPANKSRMIEAVIGLILDYQNAPARTPAWDWALKEILLWAEGDRVTDDEWSDAQDSSWREHSHTE